MFIALSLFLLYVFGLGLLPLLMLPRLVEECRSPRESAQIAAIILILGISIDYTLVLIFHRLDLSHYAGSILSLAGFSGSTFVFREHLSRLFSLRWYMWVMIFYLVFIYSFVILYEPLHSPDARSIWFFHAKLIYYNNGLDLSLPSGWNNAGISFSHVDYPKLLPVLAAQSARITGYWNEYVPKLSLLIFLIPALFASFSFSERIRFSTVFLICSVYFVLGHWLWNGYADGYLAVYGALSCIYLSKWLKSEHRLDLLSGFLFLSVTANIKNEGSLYALVVIVCTAAVILLSDKKFRAIIPAGGFRYIILLLIPFFGFLIWNVKKLSWGLQNDLHLGVGLFTRISERVGTGQIPFIAKVMFIDSHVITAAALLLVAVAIAKALGSNPRGYILLPVSIALIYCTGMLVIYAGTPHELEWHVMTSAGRTMLPVILCLFAATFFLLQGIEEREKDQSGPSQVKESPDAFYQSDP